LGVSNDFTVDSFAVHMWDTAGDADYDQLRPLSYPETDCFIITYACNNEESFTNIDRRWLPELAREARGSLFIAS